MAIVCGVDFSEPSGRAALIAAKIAALDNDVLYLVHVREEQPATLKERDEEEVARVRQRLAQEAKSLIGITDVRVEILAGLPDEQMLKFAREHDARLIVVASLGRRSAERARLGSVAERLCRSGERPILVIRDSRPLEKWIKGGEPLRLLLGLEGGGTSEGALRWTSYFRKSLKTDVTAARVYWPPEEWRRLGAKGLVQLTGPQPEIEQALSAELAQSVRALEGQGDVSIRLISSLGRASDALSELAMETGAELIVMGAHHRSAPERLWFGSVSQAVLHRAQASVLIVPTESDRRTPLDPPTRVLVAVDFSPVSERAIGRGFSVLQPGGTVRLVHVVSPRCDAEQEASLRERLRGLIPQESAMHGLWTEVEVAKGNIPSDAICQAAERFNADFICMGTSGRSKWIRAALGSVADAVMRESPRPVILVKPPA